MDHLHEYESVRQIAKEYNVPIIHDAAHSLVLETQSRNVGSKSDIAIFSFDPVKNITCIDGGVVIAQEKKHSVSCVICQLGQCKIKRSFIQIIVHIHMMLRMLDFDITLPICMQL